MNTPKPEVGMVHFCMKPHETVRIALQAGQPHNPNYLKGVFQEFLKRVVKDAIIYAEHDRRKCVNVRDVERALKLNGIVVQ